MSGSNKSSKPTDDGTENHDVEPHEIGDEHGHNDAHQDTHEEDHHVSFATVSLQILAILVVGGALALWLGPKLAPNLPSGMGAVARWLTPGASIAEEQVAALRSTLDARLVAQAPQIDMLDIDARIAQSGEVAALGADLAALQARLDVVELLPADLDDRVARVESRIDAAEAMGQSLESQLHDLVTGGLAPDSQAAADITAYSATIEALRSRIADLDTLLAEQAARIDAITADIQSEAQSAIADATAARAISELQAALIALEAALTDGLPYGGTLEWLKATQAAEVPNELAAQAQTGVISNARLLAAFPTLAHEAIRIDIRRSSADSTLGQFEAFLQSQIASRALTPQAGDGVDAILSRAEAALRRADLDVALGEMEILPAHAQDVFAGWLDSAAQRQSVLGAYRVLKSTLLEQAQ